MYLKIYLLFNVPSTNNVYSTSFCVSVPSQSTAFLLLLQHKQSQGFIRVKTPSHTINYSVAQCFPTCTYTQNEIRAFAEKKVPLSWEFCEGHM